MIVHTYVCVHVEARGQNWVFLSGSSYFKTMPLTEPGPYQLVRLVGQGTTLPVLGYRYTLLWHLFYTGAGDPNLGLYS